MSRGSVFQPEYGLIGAGAVNASLIGRIPGISRALGPVAGVSYRVASRIANTLRAGHAVRSADELDSVRLILFYSPPEQVEALTALLKAANIRWTGKSLIFFECGDFTSARTHFLMAGASVASLRPSGIPGRAVVEGTAPALTLANGLARGLGMKPVEIAAGSEAVFDAAVTMGSSALTPLIDYAANLLRECGVRDTEAVRLAAALFEQTARDYAHSGKQSWAWHKRGPEPGRLTAQLLASGKAMTALLSGLILLGFEGFEKHPDAANAVREWLSQNPPVC